MQKLHIEKNPTLTLTSTHCWQNMCRHRSKMHFFSCTLQTGQLMRPERYFTCVVICSMVKADPAPPSDFPDDAAAFIADSLASFWTTANRSTISLFSSSFFLDSEARSSHRPRAASRSFAIEAACPFDCARRPSICSFSSRSDWHSFCRCCTFSSRI